MQELPRFGTTEPGNSYFVYEDDIALPPPVLASPTGDGDSPVHQCNQALPAVEKGMQFPGRLQRAREKATRVFHDARGMQARLQAQQRQFEDLQAAFDSAKGPCGEVTNNHGDKSDGEDLFKHISQCMRDIKMQHEAYGQRTAALSGTMQLIERKAGSSRHALCSRQGFGAQCSNCREAAREFNELRNSVSDAVKDLGGVRTSQELFSARTEAEIAKMKQNVNNLSRDLCDVKTRVEAMGTEVGALEQMQDTSLQANEEFRAHSAQLMRSVEERTVESLAEAVTHEQLSGAVALLRQELQAAVDAQATVANKTSADRDEIYTLQDEVQHGLGAIVNTQRDVEKLCEEMAHLRELLCNESSDGQEATTLLKQQLGNLHRESSKAVEDLQQQVNGLCAAVRDGGNWSCTPEGGRRLSEELRDTADLFEDMEAVDPPVRRPRSAVRLTGLSTSPSESGPLEMLQREVAALKERADFQSGTSSRSIEEEMAEVQKLTSLLDSLQQQSGQLQDVSSVLVKDLKGVVEAMASLRQQVQLLNEKSDDNASQVEELRDELSELRMNVQPRARKTVCFSGPIMATASNASTASTVPNENAAGAEASQQIQGIIKRLDDIQAASSHVLQEVRTNIGLLRDEFRDSKSNGYDPVLQSKMMENVADLRQQLTQLLELCAGNRSQKDAAMATGTSCFDVSMPSPATDKLAPQAVGEDDNEFEEEDGVQLEMHNLFWTMAAPLTRDIASLQQGHASLERAMAASNLLAAGSALVESMHVESMHEHF